MRKGSIGRKRRGNVVMLTGALLPFLLSMVALSVDVGYAVVVKSQLQNAADSSALAGASALLPFIPQMAGNSTLPVALNAAIGTAVKAKTRQFSALNVAGGVSVTIPANRDADIVFGYQTAPGMPVLTTTTNFPNAVQVTVRRDALANGQVPLFFAPIKGFMPWTLTATSTAALRGSATNFAGVSGSYGKLLPLTIRASLWTTLMTTGLSMDGTRQDGFSVSLTNTSHPSNVSSGGDGVPELVDTAFGGKTDPGNFGWLDVGPDANDTPTLVNWMLNGQSAADNAYLVSSGKLPVSAVNPQAWKGAPGNKQPVYDALTSIIGEPRLLPLYSTTTGTGSNATYNIVGFAACVVVSTSNGLVLQPAVVTDPFAVSSSSSTATVKSDGTGTVYSTHYTMLSN